MAADVAQLRARVMKVRNVGERQLSRLVAHKQNETLLPTRLALLALAMESGISITQYASEEDLALLRAARSQTPVMGEQASPRPVPRKKSAAPRKRASAVKPSSKAAPTRRAPGDRSGDATKTVFVVHGRHDALRKSVFEFLRSVGLRPLEWRTAIGKTGKPNPTISEILDAAFAEAAAVVVLLTPDDHVTLRAELRKESDPPHEARRTGQARPNVLFELGLAFGHNEGSTVVVQVGGVKPFSDVAGRHITRLDNSPEKRSEFLTKLRNAGCEVDDSGTDWYSAGDFTLGFGGSG